MEEDIEFLASGHEVDKKTLILKDIHSYLI